MYTIVVANQKGGVGKTTSANNIAFSLAEQGFKVLLIDLDPQGRLTSRYGFDKEALHDTVYDIMHDIITGNPVTAVAHKISDSLSIIPTNQNLASMQMELITVPFMRESVLKDALNEMPGKYDYCVVDNDSSLGVLLMNALMIADEVVVPVIPNADSGDGLDLCINTLRMAKARMNPNLRIGGIFFTLVEHDGTKIAPTDRKYMQKIRESYGKDINIFDTIIRDSRRVKAAADKGLSMGELGQGKNDTANEYRALTEEITGGANGRTLSI